MERLGELLKASAPHMGKFPCRALSADLKFYRAPGKNLELYDEWEKFSGALNWQMRLERRKKGVG
jgi:hypothetical protein